MAVCDFILELKKLKACVDNSTNYVHFEQVKCLIGTIFEVIIKIMLQTSGFDFELLLHVIKPS